MKKSTAVSPVDCLVVGAGWSGLAAARTLLCDSISPPSVLILEASDRVGGRTLTDKEGTDLGGAYIGPGQRHLLQIVDSLGAKVYKVPTDGKTAQSIRNVVKHYQGTIPPISFFGALCLNDALVKMEELVDSIDPDHPELAPRAVELDSISFQQWMKEEVITGSSQAHKDARTILEVAIQTVLCVSTSEVSALGVAWYMATSGGTKRCLETKDGLQDSKIEGGMGNVAVKLASSLVATASKSPNKGQAPHLICYDSPVRSINYSGKEAVEVTYWVASGGADGEEYRTVVAKYVILAIPPVQQLKIQFTPSLSPQRHQALQRWPMGHIIKTFMFYKTPFWRDKGLVGAMVCDKGPAIVTMDDTKPDGSLPAIMGFVPADQAVYWGGKSKEDRQKALAAHYAAVFQDKRALEFVSYKEKNWAEEPWVGGCYSGVPQVKALTNYPLRDILCKPLESLPAPVGKTMKSHPAVFVAGTEAAKKSVGYIDGAIEAGSRAGENVLDCLRCSPYQDMLRVPDKSPQMKEVVLAVTRDEKVLHFVHCKLLPFLPLLLLVIAISLLLLGDVSIGEVVSVLTEAPRHCLDRNPSP